MASLNEDGGIHLDIEVKLLFAVSLYALVKLMGSTSLFVANWLGKAVFVCGHVFFVMNSFKTQKTVSQMSASHEVKTNALSKLKGIFKSVMGRAAVIVLIHWKTGMLPPLFISVCFSVCDAIENPYYVDTLVKLYPRVFGGLESLN